MLNVVEPVWSRLTWRRLGCVAQEHATHLKEYVVSGLRAIQDNQQALCGFWRQLPLTFPPGTAWEKS